MQDKINGECGRSEKESEKILAYVGFAARSRKLVLGTDRVLTCVRKKSREAVHDKVVLLAENASERTKKQLYDKCSYYGVSIFEFSNSETLGHAAGKESAASAVCITDKSLALAVIVILEKR